MTLKPDTVSPIFIHAQWRTGSTYLFHTFRKSNENYWCYQEPYNIALHSLNTDKEIPRVNTEDLNHPKLSKKYFWEFEQIRDQLKGLFDISMTFEHFFAKKNTLLPQEEKYINTLLENSRGRPLLQFCLSFGKANAFKQKYGGVHIHLWREPIHQWWSFFMGNYGFFNLTCWVYNSKNLPAVLQKIKSICNIEKIPLKRFKTVEASQTALEKKYLLPLSHKYRSFYALWLYSFIELKRCAHIEINIDKLSMDTSYRDDVMEKMKHLGIEGVDFSDCSITKLFFEEKEWEFYKKIEAEVQQIFLSYGYKKEEIDDAKNESTEVLKLNNKKSQINKIDIQRRKYLLHYVEKEYEYDLHKKFFPLFIQFLKFWGGKTKRYIKKRIKN